MRCTHICVWDENYGFQLGGKVGIAIAFVDKTSAEMANGLTAIDWLQFSEQ